MVGIALIVAGQNAEDVVVGPKNVQVDQRLNERLQLVVSEDRQVVSSDRFAWPSLATFDVWRVKMLFRDIPLEEKSSSILAVTLRFCHFPVVGEYQPNNKRNGVMGAGCQGRALLPECAEAVPLAASMGRRSGNDPHAICGSGGELTAYPKNTFRHAIQTGAGGRVNARASQG